MARRFKLQHLSRQTGTDARVRDAIKGRIRVRKYRNIPTEIDGERFDSKKEARRFVELRVLERAGEIADLTRGKKYNFSHDGVKIGTYKPDFEYTENGKRVIEDVKSTSTKTQAYRLRKRMMLAFYGIEIRET